MKKRSDYRIIKFQYDFKKPDYFLYRVEQKYLCWFWKTPDIDNILAHKVHWPSENYRRAKQFASLEFAEEAIEETLEYQKSYTTEEVVS